MRMYFLALLLLGLSGLTSACNTLRIRDWDLHDVGQTYQVASGGVIALICDGTCQGPGFTPSLTWSHPSGREVERYPGRVMSVFQESRRQIKLYLQDFKPTDEGMYTCKGWVRGRWRFARVYLKLADEITTSDSVVVNDGALISDQGSDEIHPLPQPIIAR